LENTDIFSHLTSIKYLPRWMVLFFDTALCLASYLLANLIITKIFPGLSDIRIFPLSLRLSMVLLSQVLFFWLFHTYSGILRYSGFVDAAKLLLSISANVVLLFAVNFVIYLYSGKIMFFYSGLVIFGFISFFLLFSLRLVVKNSFDFFLSNSGTITPVAIFGTQPDAIGIAKMIRSNQHIKYNLVGFIDDDKNMEHHIIMGAKVYSLGSDKLQRKVLRKIKAVIISHEKLRGIDTEKDLEIFLNNNISILTVPPVSIWQNDMPSVREIKSMQIEELLERPQINISTENIARQLKSKIVLISGAVGSIGSEIVRQITNYSPRLIVLLDQAESPMHEFSLELQEKFPDQDFSIVLGDVRNRERMEYIMDLYRPDFIYHAAAYKHVPLMEDNPVESIQVNVKGTKNMADLAVKYGVERFVMISTDKAVNPTNVMGASKRIAEIYVQSLSKKINANGKSSTKFITTRFGNVLGSNGSVIPHFKKQIESKGPVTVTHPEITRYFMTIPEACTLVLEAGAMGSGGEIYIFDMGNPVKIVDLARKMIRLAGYTPEKDIKIVYTGLRPGEKLYEELLNKKETTIETHNPKIMIAKVQEYDFDAVSAEIDELIRYSYLCKNFLTVAKMKKIVPEFLSKNSKYERLDLENE